MKKESVVINRVSNVAVSSSRIFLILKTLCPLHTILPFGSAVSLGNIVKLKAMLICSEGRECGGQYSCY